MGSLAKTTSLRAMAPFEKNEKTTQQDQAVLKAELERFKLRCAELETLIGAVHEDDISSVVGPKASRDRGHENVFLFVPNLIGYIRILFMLLFLRYMDEDPIAAVILYGVSCLLDAFDGWAARILDQCSQFGAVLDMVTDRCTTTFLFFSLAASIPQWKVGFQLLCALDWVSHYVHMRATAATGKSHKSVEAEQSWILSLYYTNKVVLFVLCFLNEAFFVALYMLSALYPFMASDLFLGQMASGLTAAVTWVLRLSLPGMILKQLINILQLVRASQSLVAMDREVRSKKAG